MAKGSVATLRRDGLAFFVRSRQGLSMNAQATASTAGSALAPYPGSKEMPRWTVNRLIDAPTFTWRNWASMLGPGLLAGGAAIGGGEWLMGPIVTARYGGSLLWLSTLSILG